MDCPTTLGWTPSVTIRPASHTIAELLPCVESPSEENSESSLERMVLERDRLSRHLTDLVRTRRTLDEVIASARAYRQELRASTKSAGQPDAAVHPHGSCAANSRAHSGVEIHQLATRNHRPT